MKKDKNVTREVQITANENQILSRLKNIKPSTYLTGAICISLLIPAVIYAGTLNIDRAVEAGFNPLMKGLSDHWGKGVLLSGGAAALMGEGDPKQRAVRAGIGCIAGGSVILGLIALLA